MNTAQKNQSNIFINSGIRNKINEGLITKKDFETLGYAIGCLLAQEFDNPCNILIATDTRSSCEWMKNELTKGLVGFGHDLFDAGIAPTPFVAKAIKDFSTEYENDEEFNEENEDQEQMFTLGIVITASHNNAEYNGIKILTEIGYLNIEMEEAISELFYEFSGNLKDVEPMLANEIGNVISFDLQSFYKSELIEELENAPYKNLRVLLDCANGATAKIAEQMFKTCKITTVSINNSLDGSLINKDSGCSNNNLLISAIEKNNADWGCAFDGDGDRVIIANNKGEFFDGDDILAVIIQHPRYKNEQVYVGTNMSNGGLDTYFASLQKKFIKTNVGERNIINALVENQALLGSESCGHITMMDHAFCSDGIFAALMFFDTLAAGTNIQLRPYKKLHQMHATLPLNSNVIDQKSITKAINSLDTQLARIVVRPSNTEPILRIMVEHSQETIVQSVLNQLTELLKKGN